MPVIKKDSDPIVNASVSLDLPLEAARAKLLPQEVWSFAAAILLSAILLFQVQLIIGKYILPWFGGAPAVWTTCMLAFQVLLLMGYIYAHLLATRLPLPLQIKIHLSLLGVSVLLMIVSAVLWPSPITPGSSWKPEGDAQPIWQIVRLLTVGIGLPFFLLAATSPLLQEWLARTRSRSPYRLFALSNFGSLLGLLTYPFLIEPHLTLRHQAWMWSGGYGAYIIIGAFCAMLTYFNIKGPAQTPVSHPSQTVLGEDRPGAGLYFLWLFLAACACTMFLATTNMLCQEIAVIPFLWVLPLSLYLLTFIASFESSRWYRRSIFHSLYLISLVLVLLTQKAKVLPQVGSYSLALFVVGMICHGELSRLKPATKYLTHFYLMIALGGAFGGVFVALIAPLIFSAFWEFQMAFLFCGLLLFIVLFRDRSSWFYRNQKWLPLGLVVGVAALVGTAGLISPVVFTDFSKKIYLVFLWVGAGMMAAWPVVKPGKVLRPYRWTQAYILGILILVGVALVMQMHSQVKGSFVRFRSFFGAFRIERKNTALLLYHGRTMHGWQIRDGVHDPTPTSYYATNTGIGKLLLNHPRRDLASEERDLRIGVVGLGAGTLAAYGSPWDYYCFYEIDPEIVKISQGPEALFTFLKNSTAKIDVVLGDGRLSLEREAARGEFQKFDVLVLDAFSSDSIPVHLLTKEAMQLYLKHLRDQDSVVAFHISNRILDLAPVIKGLSREFNLALIIVDSFKGPVTSGSRWGLLSRNPRVFEIPKLKSHAEPARTSGGSAVLWTDDYSNLYQLIYPKAWW